MHTTKRKVGRKTWTCSNLKGGTIDYLNHRHLYRRFHRLYSFCHRSQNECRWIRPQRSLCSQITFLLPFNGAFLVSKNCSLHYFVIIFRWVSSPWSSSSFHFLGYGCKFFMAVSNSISRSILSPRMESPPGESLTHDSDGRPSYFEWSKKEVERIQIKIGRESPPKIRSLLTAEPLSHILGPWKDPCCSSF